MKFLITWKIHEGKLHETLGLFSQMPPEQEQAMMGPSVKMIGRWHNTVQGSGAAVYEAESSSAIAAYALNWSKYMDLEISPVTDDEETRAIGRAM